jgi:ribosomal protein S18 acetylase RimI-like enzyme
MDREEIETLEPLWNALREHHARVSPNFGAPRPRADSWGLRLAQYESWLQEPDSFVLLAERESNQVGYAMVHLRAGSPTWPLGERAGELETLAVLRQERGKGTGSALLGAVRERLVSLGVQELSLHVVPGNARAIRFYERHGFGTYGLMLRADVAS